MNRIDGNNPLATSRLGQGLPASDVNRGDEAGKEASSVSRGDLAAISNRGRFVAAAMRSVQDAPDVRWDRVAELKSAIADGAYHSNARGIAARLMAGGTLGVE
jgi:flagellar biosynthesis anti-sigma factor FlgM